MNRKVLDDICNQVKAENVNEEHLKVRNMEFLARTKHKKKQK